MPPHATYGELPQISRPPNSPLYAPPVFGDQSARPQVNIWSWLPYTKEAHIIGRESANKHKIRKHEGDTNLPSAYSPHDRSQATMKSVLIITSSAILYTSFEIGVTMFIPLITYFTLGTHETNTARKVNLHHIGHSRPLVQRNNQGHSSVRPLALIDFIHTVYCTVWQHDTTDVLMLRMPSTTSSTNRGRITPVRRQ